MKANAAFSSVPRFVSPPRPPLTVTKESPGLKLNPPGNLSVLLQAKMQVARFVGSCTGVVNIDNCEIVPPQLEKESAFRR